jgi:hypothetical protein
MVKKTDQERLKDLEMKMETIKAKKLQLEARLKEKERKERTRRLIQVGAIFERYFDIAGPDEAEKIAFVLREQVNKNKEKIMKIDLEKLKEKV